MPVMMRDVLDGEDWGAELSLTYPPTPGHEAQSALVLKSSISSARRFCSVVFRWVPKRTHPFSYSPQGANTSQINTWHRNPLRHDP
jgi:hypothetical protein